MVTEVGPFQQFKVRDLGGGGEINHQSTRTVHIHSLAHCDNDYGLL